MESPRFVTVFINRKDGSIYGSSVGGEAAGRHYLTNPPIHCEVIVYPVENIAIRTIEELEAYKEVVCIKK